MLCDNDQGDHRCDIVFFAALPNLIVSLLELSSVRRLDFLPSVASIHLGPRSPADPLGKLVSFFRGREHAGRVTLSGVLVKVSISSLYRLTLALVPLPLVRINDLKDLSIEQVVKDAVTCRDE